MQKLDSEVGKVLKSVILNDLERRNDRQRAPPLQWLSFSLAALKNSTKFNCHILDP